jgi:RiboL-PSP-HEPN
MYMSSNAKTKFDQNKKDIDRLWNIHQEITGGGPGRKYDVDVINRAAIVFITACWESFVEDLATESFDFLINNVSKALDIPSKVRDIATKQMFTQQDSRKVWELADSGWRRVIIDHKTDVIKRWIDSLNTPRTAQVNTLFEELLGCSKVSEKWFWKKMSAVQSSDKLEKFMTVRGDIAHRTQTNKAVYKNWGTNYLNLIEKLVEKTEETIFDHLRSVTSQNPW